MCNVPSTLRGLIYGGTTRPDQTDPNDWPRTRSARTQDTRAGKTHYVAGYVWMTRQPSQGLSSAIAPPGTAVYTRPSYRGRPPYRVGEKKTPGSQPNDLQKKPMGRGPGGPLRREYCPSYLYRDTPAGFALTAPRTVLTLLNQILLFNFADRSLCAATLAHLRGRRHGPGQAVKIDQRRMGIGYNHATRIMQYLEATRYVSEPDDKGERRFR